VVVRLSPLTPLPLEDFTMQPEDRVTAERLWSSYGALAHVIRASINIPDAVLLTTGDLLLMVEERAWWKEQAEEGMKMPAPAAMPSDSAQPAPAATVAADASDAATQRPPDRPAAPAMPKATTAFPPPGFRPPVAVAASTTGQTPERLDLLRQLWTDDTLSIADIHRRIIALPGPVIRAPTKLYGWAQDLHLVIPRPYNPPGARKRATAAPGKPATKAAQHAPTEAFAPPVQIPRMPQPKVDAPPPPPTSPPEPTPAPTKDPGATGQRKPRTQDDDWHDAREMLLAGLSVVRIAEELDLPKGKVSELKFRLDEERDAKRKAGQG
jgi:hypothetical protein